MYTELRIKSTYMVILGQSAFEMPSRRNNNVDVTCSTLYIKCITMRNIKCAKPLKKSFIFTQSYNLKKKITCFFARLTVNCRDNMQQIHGKK